VSVIPHRRLVVAAVAGALAVAGATASAATRNGVTPLSPKPGAVVPKGMAVTFKGRARGPGPIFVHVCTSARKSKRDGTICKRATIGQARKTGSRFSYRQKTYSFPAYWLNRPGTYYWQAHRIACENANTSDCRQEGPVVRFRVR
jgi:hypothetical protein